MENNEITSREELKTYFETSKYPTENQFADLIDSLKHKQDSLTNKEVAMIANSLATIENGYINYVVADIGTQKLSVIISSSDEEDQVIKIGSSRNQEKRYFFGSAPYNIKVRDLPVEGLTATEYYVLSYQINSGNTVTRAFGNNLTLNPDEFEFGTLEGVMFNFYINKSDFGQRVNIIHTKISFINRTEVSIRYKAQAGIWGDTYRTEDTITNHYDMWDDLSILYTADLRGFNRSVECNVYNADNNSLLMTCALDAGLEYQNIWGGGQATGVRNIRIECDYQQRL